MTILSRLPERVRCDCRDKYPGYQAGPDLPLGRLWAEAPHTTGSPTSELGKVQIPYQSVPIWAINIPQEQLPHECSLLARQ